MGVLRLEATSTDAEDGDLSNAIQWSSDKDGTLGTGSTLSISTLSNGMHVLTASSTDSDNATGIARRTLMVGDPTPVATYSHNALGQRVKKTDETSGSTTHFIYDPEGRLIAEIDAQTGDTRREYVYVNGQQVALVDDTQTQNEEVYFVHNDHLGTPQKITSQSQQVVWAADYEPFGKAAITTNTTGNAFNIRFPGQYEDEESGLHYNYFRDYDPSVGRYIESDPIGLAGGRNTYAYVANNPLRFSDSYGLQLDTATSYCRQHPLACPINSQAAKRAAESAASAAGAIAAELMLNDIHKREDARRREAANDEGDECEDDDSDDECNEWYALLVAQWAQINEWDGRRDVTILKKQWNQQAGSFVRMCPSYSSRLPPRFEI